MKYVLLIDLAEQAMSEIDGDRGRELAGELVSATSTYNQRRSPVALRSS